VFELLEYKSIKDQAVILKIYIPSKEEIDAEINA
jgi:hypothetical protein